MLFCKKKRKWPELGIEAIRKRARILVIDDQAFPYQPLFSRDGYQIDKWDDITDLTKLESGYYDIVLLDIQGIGRQESREQGFGILKHIRSKSPIQIIVAYSNSDWPLKYQEFFDMADAKLDKRQDYVDFKRVVDDLLQSRFSLGFYLKRIEKAAQGKITEIDKLLPIATESIFTGSLEKVQTFLTQNAKTAEAGKAVVDIIGSAIEIYKICSGA